MTNFVLPYLKWHTNTLDSPCLDAIVGSKAMKKNNIFLFVTYTIIQSITSSEMCSQHLTHPSAHTLGAVGNRRCGWGFGALHKGLTSVVDSSCQSQDSNPQPQVTSPTLFPLGHDCPLNINSNAT